MRMNDAFPSKYLKADDLEEGDLIVTIKGADYEEFTDPKTKKTDQKPVLYFEGNDSKPLVLNKTNWKTIAEILGTDDTDDWTGKKIVLYATEVEAYGETMLGIRVRLKAPTKPAAAAKQTAKPQAAKPQAAKPRNVQDDPFPENLTPEVEDIPF